MTDVSIKFKSTCRSRSLAPLFVLAVAAPAVHADNGVLAVSPILSSRVIEDDNRRLRLGSAKGDFYNVTSAEVQATYAAPTYSITVDPRTRISRYVNQTELNSEDIFFRTFGSKIFSQDQLGAEFNYMRESTTTTELTDTGLVDTNLPRTTLGGNISWDHTFSDRFDVAWNGGYTRVTFEKLPGGTPFVNYNIPSVGMTMTYQWDDATKLLLLADASIFDTPNFHSATIIDSQTTSYGGRIGFEHLFSSSLKATVNVGQNLGTIDSHFRQPELVSLVPFVIRDRIVSQSESTSGWLFNSRIRKVFERADVEVQWNRYFAPSSLGGRQEREQVSFEGNYQISDRITAQALFDYVTQTQEGSQNQRVFANDILSASARVLYKFNKQLRLDLTYRYRQNEFNGASTAAMSNSVELGLTITGDMYPVLE